MSRSLNADSVIIATAVLGVLTICYETRIPVSNRCTKWDINVIVANFARHVCLSDTKTLQLPQLTLNAGDSWAFVGSNGSGKSALARALAGELPLLKGERQSQFSHITRLSFEQLQNSSATNGSGITPICSALAKMTPDALRLRSFRMK